MGMATNAEIKADKLAALEQRSAPAGRLPIEAPALEPLPAEVLRAFPSMREWHKRCNARFSQFTAKMNTVVPT